MSQRFCLYLRSVTFILSQFVPSRNLKFLLSSSILTEALQALLTQAHLTSNKKRKFLAGRGIVASFENGNKGFLNELKEEVTRLPDLHASRVEEIKEEIAKGSYFKKEAVLIAAQRLADLFLGRDRKR